MKIILISLVIFFAICSRSWAEDIYILDKESARSMFSTSKLDWVSNLKQFKETGMADYEIDVSGEYTMKARPDINAGLLLVTPHYKDSDTMKPWRINITVIADTEPAFSLYNSFNDSAVEDMILKQAMDFYPEFSVIGYKLKGDNYLPNINFVIFEYGKYPEIDNLVKNKKPCPPKNGKMNCITDKPLF